MRTYFFAGANSGSGFQNLFPELVDLEDTYDMMILKGGPGVGKNTLMQGVSKALEQAGTNVEYIWCSGDPASLDGVVFPQIHCAIVDGTAPHVVEPKYPAAVDRYVDLGQFYDLNGAKHIAQAVKSQTKVYQKAYAQACHSLQMARRVELEGVAAAESFLDQDQLRQQVHEILTQEFQQQGRETGTVQKRFLGTITHQGYVWRFNTVKALCPKVYEWVDSWEQAGSALAQLCAAAGERGWNSIACMAPEEPERMEHLLIPGLGLAFLTAKPGMQYGEIPYRRIQLDSVELPEGYTKFLTNQADMAHLLRQEAVQALKEAKRGHDVLEEMLHPYVNFEGVQALTALETKRFLSYLK